MFTVAAVGGRPNKDSSSSKAPFCSSFSSPVDLTPYGLSAVSALEPAVDRPVRICKAASLRISLRKQSK